MHVIELEKTFNPKDFEERIYALWTSRDCFKPESGNQGRYFSDPSQTKSKDPDASDKPFVIVIPPPNVTGVLHLGHGLNSNLQDILVRFHRMLGEKTLWVPGTDHAGIATQSVVEKKLRAKGIRRTEIGRKAFLEETWKVKEEHHGIISDQLKKIGSSCDWSRERFTMDEGLSQAVKEVFVTLYERSLIYRGTYLVNWSVGVQSALSDDEVEFKEVKGKMYKIRYPLADGSGFLQIATTRPETLLGDTALAVHPEDDRYSRLHGKEVVLPLCNRNIKIIADGMVARDFGTGVVKITPAHDFNDYQTGKRHNLEEINIMNPDGTIADSAPEKYRGLKMIEARKAVIEDLEALGLFDGADEHIHQVGHCYRTDTIIEPYLSEQWFVRMQPLAQKALKALEDGQIRFYPKRWENTYSHWMLTIRDWCISRQLWWGHRIPVWYDLDSGEMIVSRGDPSTEAQYAGRRLKQDEDVLDTWFSSWLWPFSVMGWPQNTSDLKTYYPTSTLVTAYDIIFFWVARMVMAGLEFTGQVPFKDIYITPLVRDKQGRKMSKSLGNGIDPIEIVDQFGADALKFTLAFLSAQGQDILMDKESFGIGSRFANKIWNATRYILMNIEGRTYLSFKKILAGDFGGLSDIDRWILHRLNQSAKIVRQALIAYRFNDASSAAYEFFWNDFCDWYIEASKLSLYQGDDAEKDRALTIILHVLEESLKLLHPFLPLLSEEIYQRLPQNSDPELRRMFNRPEGLLLINQPYPQFSEKFENTSIVAGFDTLAELVRGIRTLRSEFTVSPAAKIVVAVNLSSLASNDTDGLESQRFIQKQAALISSLAGLGKLDWFEAGSSAPRPGAIALAGKTWEALVYIKDSIDLAAVVARLEKTIEKEEKALVSMAAKLCNPGFLKNAGAEVIDKERQKVADLEAAIVKMKHYVTELVDL